MRLYNVVMPLQSVPAALLLIAGFDVVVGALLLRYWSLLRAAGRARRIAPSWAVIISLVNASGFFCAAPIVEAVAGLGGLGLAVLLLVEIGKLEKSRKV